MFISSEFQFCKIKKLSSWECKLVQPLWETVWRFLKKLKMELPYDPATAPLGIYPKDTKIQIQRGTGTPVFIAAVSTITKFWKQPKSPSTDEWIKNLWDIIYIHNWILLSHKKNEILLFSTTWVELESIMLSEISQGKTNTIWLLSCMEFKKQNK